MGLTNQMLHDVSRDDYWIKLDTCIRKMQEVDSRTISGILVSGHTGSGKTFLVENYIKSFESLFPVLVARHNVQHEGIPYFGLKYSFADFISKIQKQYSHAGLQDFSQRLKERLGDSFPLLIDYIPELTMLSGNEPGFPQKIAPKTENQLYPLFKILFEFLSDYYKKPIIFFTDDLQWIDVSGINLLKFLILNLAPQKLIWIGACRAPQENVNSVRQLNEALGFAKREIEHIFLSGLNENQVRNFMESAFNGPCHQDFVAVCFALSEGNPSHLQVLLESLKHSEYIWQKNGMWYCDQKAISLRFKGQNTKIILRERLKALSDPARDMLSIMACMGLFSRRTIMDWLIDESFLIDSLVEEAIAAGLLEHEDDNIRFSEMHLGEMIYNDLPLSKRQELHYKIAKLLYSRGLEQLNATKIILMTTHFDQALELVKANNEALMVAELNYKAGNFAKQDNALDQARYFFKMSADLIKKYPRHLVFDLGRLVYMERARVEYFLGEYDLAEIHLDYLLDRLTDALKKAKAYELKITINNHLGRYRKAVQILKESLGELGLELPLEEEKLIVEVNDLKREISQTEQKTTAADRLDPEKEKAILKLLNVGGMSLHHTSDVLMTWAALQIINRSRRGEVVGVSAIGYVSYGRMLIIAGDIDKGVELGQKGVTINNTLEDIDLRCRVYGVYAFYIQPWKKSFGDSMKLLEKGIDAGRKSGDLIGLYILKTHQFNLHFISGLPLQELLKWDFQESYSGLELTYYITHYQKSLIRFLVGESAVFSIPRQQSQWLAARLTIQEEKFYRNYVWARYYFLFGHYELAEAAAREAHMNRKLQEGSPLMPSNLVLWFLSMTQNWENFSEAVLDGLKEKAKDILNNLDLWRKYAPVNYNALWLLINAEWERVQGNSKEAIILFKKSIDTAGGNIYCAAVAHELLAKHLLILPYERENARQHLLEAVRCFKLWGAKAKATQLIQQYQSFLFDLYPKGQEIDIEMIQHELSGDMEVASLVKKLMVLLLRISGSTRVVIEFIEDSGNLSFFGSLSALYNERSKDNNKLDHTGIPASMILMAHRMQQPIVVNDLEQEKGLRDLKAIRKKGVQSFLIVPVTVNGHISIVVYLENVFSSNWYTEERVKWTRIVANQGAVIIENASIHERSVKLNEEIRREMAEKERLASLIEAQKDAHLRDLIQTQDNERKRIAADLHDSLGSLLSSVKLRFDGLQEGFGKEAPEKIVRYNDTMGLLDEAIQELRRIAHNMSPVALRRFGLKASLQSFVEQLNASEKIEIDLQVLGLDKRLPEEIEISAYRICQELVQNVIKHAKTAAIRIQLIAHSDSLNIIVEDEGIGMDKGEVAPGFGFSTIQSKVNLFKGSFTIESKPGKGTMVLVDFPLNQ